MKRFIIILIFSLANILPVLSTAKEPVILSQIYDGDTIEVINLNNEKEVIRLYGIDYYETSLNNRVYKQAYENHLKVEEVVKRGTKSKLVLVDFFKTNPEKQLYVVRHTTDKYKRTVGTLYLDDINVNEYMLKKGNAKKYTFIKY